MTTRTYQPVPGVITTDKGFKGTLHPGGVFSPPHVLWRCPHEHGALPDAVDCARAELARRVGRES